ncbi:MAG TPA: hypothetical protein PLU10_00530 [Chitinophagaceae bacterium]|nr:hypothetical protein [Chitinophagaceae bacterium]
MRAFLSVLLLLVAHVASSVSIENLWTLHQQQPENTQTISAIFRWYETTGSLSQKDSALLVLKNLDFNQDKTTLHETYAAYFQVRTFHDKTFAIQQTNEWVALHQNSKNIHFLIQAFSNQFGVLWNYTDYQQAAECAAKCLYYANATGDIEFKIMALLQQGRSLEHAGNHNEAFRNYLDAYYYSLEKSNSNQTMLSLRAISEFFVTSKLYEKAIQYKRKEIDVYVTTVHPLDSFKYMNLISELSDHLYDMHDEQNANVYSQLVTRFALTHQDRKLLTYHLTILRSHYFETNNFDALIDLYTVQFPHEIDSLANSNKAVYYRIQSLIAEKQQNLPVAKMYLDSAETILYQQNEPLLLSNFFIRKGEFFLRHHQPDEAIMAAKQAFELAQSRRYFPFMNTAAENLDSAYCMKGDFKQAHSYQEMAVSYADSLQLLLDKDEIILLEVDNLEKQKELFQKQQESEVVRKNNLQYMIIVILIAISFLIFLLAGSFKIHKLIIRGLGYFVFIFLFEFIILLADHKIHHMTHGEPLKIMGLKIILIGFLLPIHHWVEEKAVHYLLHHKILLNFKFSDWLKGKTEPVIMRNPRSRRANKIKGSDK